MGNVFLHHRCELHVAVLLGGLVYVKLHFHDVLALFRHSL